MELCRVEACWLNHTVGIYKHTGKLSRSSIIPACAMHEIHKQVIRTLQYEAANQPLHLD